MTPRLPFVLPPYRLACGLTVVLLAGAASAQTAVRPGAPGEPTHVLHASEAEPRAPAPHTDADVAFMQGMIPHHAQALEMTALVRTRTTRRDVLLLAERIEVAQRDEIAQMTRWLHERGHDVPETHAHAHHHGGHDHHGAGHALMPGMLTPEEMAALTAASGPDFDRLFLTSMIRHHEGALVMVADLFASPGAAQTPEVYQIATDVDADQRADILRMRAMLGAEAPPAHEH